MTGHTVAELPAPPRGRTSWPWAPESEPLPGSHWPRITVVTPSFQQGESVWGRPAHRESAVRREGEAA